jgi:hypothetical protein
MNQVSHAFINGEFIIAVILEHINILSHFQLAKNRICRKLTEVARRGMGADLFFSAVFKFLISLTVHYVHFLLVEGDGIGDSFFLQVRNIAESFFAAVSGSGMFRISVGGIDLKVNASFVLRFFEEIGHRNPFLALLALQLYHKENIFSIKKSAIYPLNKEK